MQKKVLIIDDNEDIISFIKPALNFQGFIVDFATNGSEAIKKLTDDLSIILLDVSLPDLNGFELCREIKKRINCPIIFLTAHGLEQERINGFLVGGDDYIVKPFSIKELILRINVHLKRYSQDDSNKKKVKCLNFNGLTIDLLSKSVKANGKLLDFTKKEYEIMELLCTHPGQVFSKEQIFEIIWGTDSDSELSTITEHIKRIRYKLKLSNMKDQFISTVWGIGYKWEF